MPFALNIGPWTLRKGTLLLSLSFCGLVAHAQPATLTMWKDTAMGAIYNSATTTVAYGKPDANNYYKIFLSDTAGNNETPLTYAGWPVDRHQWAEEWDPTGQYLFCYVEKPLYATEPAHTRIPADATPGYGAYTDIWLLRRDGSEAWQLTNLPNDYDHGVCHGAISQDGTLFAWTERIQAPNIWDPNLVAGAYVFKVADVTYSPTPALSNIRTFQPGGVLAGGEVESISIDNTTLAVYSTFETQSIYNTPLYTIDIVTEQTTRLTTTSFAQCPTYTPDGAHFVYMWGQDCDIFPLQLQGADWWIMDADSTNKQRLTFMNVTGNPQCVNAYRLAGSISFLSENSFLGGVMTFPFGLTGYTAKVDMGTMTGLVDVENATNGVTILPNPAHDRVTIKPDHHASDLTVTMFNAYGQQLETMRNTYDIDISQLPMGTYIVEVQLDQERFCERIVKH